MSTVKLSKECVELARQTAKVSCRSIPKQIEYWMKIGKIAEENPDLPYEFIKGTLIGLNELEEGKTSDYEFG